MSLPFPHSDTGTLFLPDTCEAKNVKSEPCPRRQTGLSCCPDPDLARYSRKGPQVYCHLPGCASYNLGSEWTPLPSSSWPGSPPAVRSVRLWSPGEGSRKEMMEAWLTRQRWTSPHPGERSFSGSSVCLCPSIPNKAGLTHFNHCLKQTALLLIPRLLMTLHSLGDNVLVFKASVSLKLKVHPVGLNPRFQSYLSLLPTTHHLLQPHITSLLQL